MVRTAAELEGEAVSAGFPGARVSSGRASPVLALPLPPVRLSIGRWPGEGCRQGEGRKEEGRPHPTCVAGTWPFTRQCRPGTVAAKASLVWRTL